LTSTPCGECNTCLEISEGRSVDLIEVDAASRTGVDDMRELLDNVQYMPTLNRFKIYLIDEVHMLSRSSFNAMLKTLEEPPEHVKFLFATTDPKKLPVTVLSRCLQFNLKNLSPEQIVHHMSVVLDRESIGYDETALWQLGRAADGSMRDALSLADQAISFGNNEVREESVKSMLGSIDHQGVYDLIDAVIAEDGAMLLEKIAALSEFAPDYVALLDNILAVLHRIAIAHAVSDALDNA
jgi:DNA polymerase-3 subunit gamma/tau